MSVNDIDWELQSAVDELVENNLLKENSPGHGIAKVVIDKGYHSLSPKQAALYNSVVVSLLEKHADKNNVTQWRNSLPE